MVASVAVIVAGGLLEPPAPAPDQDERASLAE